MIAILSKTLAILTDRERKQWARLTGLTLVISIADIASLAMLIYTIHFYTQPVNAIKITTPLLGKSIAHWLPDRSSLVPITLFVVLFTLKNGAAFLIQSWQTRFVHQAASRISRNNMLQYLEGNYADYIHKDSSLFTRSISLQPLEFCQHVLAPMQQVFTEAVLIVLSIAAILIFNAQLFILLLIILLPPVMVAGWFTKRKLHKARTYIKSSRTTMWQHLHESIAGFVESNIYEKNAFSLTGMPRLNRHLTGINRACNQCKHYRPGWQKCLRC